LRPRRCLPDDIRLYMAGFNVLKPLGAPLVRLDFIVRKRVSYALETERKCLRGLISQRGCTGESARVQSSDENSGGRDVLKSRRLAAVVV